MRRRINLRHCLQRVPESGVPEEPRWTGDSLVVIAGLLVELTNCLPDYSRGYEISNGVNSGENN